MSPDAMDATDLAAPFLKIARQPRANRREPLWLTTYRANGLQRFADRGLPRRNEEGWQFTDLRPLTGPGGVPGTGQGAPFNAAQLTARALAETACRLVFVNGRFEASLSQTGELPRGAWIGSIAAALAECPERVRAAFDPSDLVGAQPFASLNAGQFSEGFIVALEPGVVLERPIEIVHFVQDGSAAHLRSVVTLGEGAKASLLETCIGEGRGWTNSVTRVDLAAGAGLRHVKVQDEAADALHISLLRASLAKSAAYDSFTATLGARMSRQDILVDLAGEGARAAIHGVYLLRGEQEATFAPRVDHRAPNCSTNEVLKGVIDDAAHGVFLGAVVVREGADGTDAHQLNRNLLLGAAARVDTKPELAILADDVKCSHGATVGDLDDASLFYLLSRGIDPRTARHMLIEAFVRDVIETAGLDGAIGAHVETHIARRLGEGAQP